MELSNLVLLIATYLIGSIPSSFLIGRLLGTPDIRSLGDGSTGAIHTAREFGARAGTLVALLDIAKGAGALLLATLADPSEVILLFSGITCIAGHNWSVFLRFSGGRGAATSFGTFITLFPTVSLITASIAVPLLLLTRKAKLVSGVAFAVLLIGVIASHPSVYRLLYGFTTPLLVLVTDVLKTKRLRSRTA